MNDRTLPSRPPMWRRRIFYIIQNAGFLSVAYLWLFRDQQWAGNITKFLVGWTFVISLLLFSEQVKQKLREIGRCMPAFVTQMMDVALAIAFASQSHFVMASVMMFSLIAESGAYEGEPDKAKEQPKPSDSDRLDKLERYLSDPAKNISGPIPPDDPTWEFGYNAGPAYLIEGGGNSLREAIDYLVVDSPAATAGLAAGKHLVKTFPKEGDNA